MTPLGEQMMSMLVAVCGMLQRPTSAAVAQAAVPQVPPRVVQPPSADFESAVESPENSTHSAPPASL